MEHHSEIRKEKLSKTALAHFDTITIPIIMIHASVGFTVQDGVRWGKRKKKQIAQTPSLKHQMFLFFFLSPLQIPALIPKYILNINTKNADSFDVLPLTACSENQLRVCALLKCNCIPLIRRQSHWRDSVTHTTKTEACAIYLCKPLMEVKTLAADCCRHHICFHALTCVIIPTEIY